MNKYMIVVSFLALFSFLTAIYLGKYYASIPAISVFITSILFWSKPEEKWRMYIDIVVVQLALYYSIFLLITIWIYKNSVATLQY